MKSLIGILLSASVILSCNSSDNKADHSDPGIDTALPSTKPKELPKTDTTNTPSTQPATTQSGQSRSVDATNPSDDILSKIDKHLVSEAVYRAVPGGGIANCTIKVTNTLPDATFQKALVEVTIRKDDNSVVKRDYFTVINIDPGMTKTIQIPDHPVGSMVVCGVIKVKSNELTKGEYVLAGNGLAAN